jgi:hypothetical protein
MSLSDIIFQTLTQFVSTIESKFEVKVPINIWESIKKDEASNGCSALLKSGINKGKQCGKSCGESGMCITHARSESSSKPVVSSTPVPVQKPRLIFRLNDHKRFVNTDYQFVICKLTRKIIGIDNGPDEPLPLNEKQKKVALEHNLEVYEPVKMPEVVSVDKCVDDPDAKPL